MDDNNDNNNFYMITLGLYTYWGYVILKEKCNMILTLTEHCHCWTMVSVCVKMLSGIYEIAIGMQEKVINTCL